MSDNKVRMNTESCIADYALAKNHKCWFKHPVLGEVSFDTFTRGGNGVNPIHRGSVPWEWPVNGFFFNDPVSHDWFVYIGHYHRGYASTAICTVKRSKDKGRTWEDLGPIFQDHPFFFEGGLAPVTVAPEISVVYTGGKYHLVYDYATDGYCWDAIQQTDHGIGYAVADRPEGPYTRFKTQIFRNKSLMEKPLCGKYNRLYATTVIKRNEDWLTLSIVDSQPFHSWGLVAMTAKDPQGPYCEPNLIFSTETDDYHPPLMEFYPAFVHDGYIYSPCTSVALNRNYNMIFRAPIERGDDAHGWEIFQDGSVWHAENHEHEYCGIWGQTFTGFVEENGTFEVMFPSRDSNGQGTINLAQRPWVTPYRDGFYLSGHDGKSLSFIRGGYETFVLDTTFTFTGEILFFWGHQGLLGPNEPDSGATLHPLSLTRHQGLRLSPDTWKIVVVDEKGIEMVIAQGSNAAIPENLQITLLDGELTLIINQKKAWQGAVEMRNGLLGILAGEQSFIHVDRYEVEGEMTPANVVALCTDGLLGAGQGRVDWDIQESPRFRYGLGAARLKEGGRAKWNIIGTGFILWMPKGPEQGRVEVRVDGRVTADLNLYTEKVSDSSIVCEMNGLNDGPHAVVVEARTGRLTIDSLEILYPANNPNQG